jgi:hypothetical protein
MKQRVDVSSGKLSQEAGGAKLLHAVFHTLAYADVFDYPLTVPEVYRYLMSEKASFQEVAQALADETRFTRIGDYFTLRGREEIVETRKRRAEVASRLWGKAARYGRIIASLPFVRMVAVTGSLSMNNTDEGKDVDYMIVTAPNRLWICRALSLLVARFAKLDGVSLCPNYLVTTNALTLNERSLYVAHELAQMIPLSGIDMYRGMLRLNDWIYEYLPNARGLPESPWLVEQDNGRSFVQRILEMTFNLPFGDWLENWERNRKIKKLTREQSSSSESYFSADVCKGHVDRHGENIGTAFAIRVQKATDIATTKTI